MINTITALSRIAAIQDVLEELRFAKNEEEHDAAWKTASRMLSRLQDEIVEVLDKPLDTSEGGD